MDELEQLQEEAVHMDAEVSRFSIDQLLNANQPHQIPFINRYIHELLMVERRRCWQRIDRSFHEDLAVCSNIRLLWLNVLSKSDSILDKDLLLQAKIH